MNIRTAAEAIAFHFSADVRDIREYQYQPSRYSRVFTLGDDYMTATSGPTPCKRFAKETGGYWQVHAHYGNWSVWKFLVSPSP